MSEKTSEISRRKFMITSSSALAALMTAAPFSPLSSMTRPAKKMRLAVVGTGHRFTGMFGKKLMRDYSDYVEIVGLCDNNPGRVKYARDYVGLDCPVFSDFKKMVKKSKPDKILVTTVDSTHHEYIIKGLEMGVDVISEKPMTTDETKAQAILDAERKSGKKVTVTFNYRYSPHRVKIKELLEAGAIGKVTSVDFHWYLDTEHGPRYFRRWHGYRDKGGTLLVHKSTHHFDLINWWLNSEPELVTAFGDLEYFGKNGDFRGKNCRVCEHKDKCKFPYDITKHKHYYNLYVKNEQYDGYMRDACIYREDIDIFDKMAVQVKYANNVQMSYSLTTYSPYEGYRIAFNGTEGRMEARIYERQPWDVDPYDEITVIRNFDKPEYFKISNVESGHGGGDMRMKDKLFKDPSMDDPYKQSAGTRDGAFSILTGIAARKSIDTGKPVKIADLTDLKPQANRA